MELPHLRGKGLRMKILHSRRARHAFYCKRNHWHIVEDHKTEVNEKEVKLLLDEYPNRLSDTPWNSEEVVTSVSTEDDEVVEKVTVGEKETK